MRYKRWEADKFSSLADLPRSGRPSTLDTGQKKIIELAKSGIVNIALCCYEWISILDKHLSKWHLIRLLKAEKFTWKRVRKSLSSQRDRVTFEFFKQELVSLRVENVKGQLSLSLVL